MSLVDQQSVAAVRTLAIASGDISRRRLAELAFGGVPPALVVGFVSPHLDFPAVAAAIRESLDADQRLVLVSTAGELCSDHPDGLYVPSEGAWDNIVLESFSRELLRNVSVHAVPLHSEDIRSGAITLSDEQRVDAIALDLAAVKPAFPLDCRDTLALAFIDGLSASESCFMEAVYATGNFPILFVGGSAGGKLDFRHTWIFDGQRVLENHAVVAFLKLAAGKHYGVFKSQNFDRTGVSFTVLDGDPVGRRATRIIDPDSFGVVGFVDALCVALECRPEELDDKLRSYTFAIDLDGELFVRSVAGIDPTDGAVSFFCDVHPGDELFLVKATDFVGRTEADFAAFLKGKPQPIGGILNDCILRRINNAPHLSGVTGFKGIPLAGLSTFGELLGIHINQTLTALFFFDADIYGGVDTEYTSSFPVHYARYQSFFSKARHNRLGMLNRIRQRLIQTLMTRTATTAALSGAVAQITTCTERGAAGGMGGLTTTVLDLLAAVQRLTTERESVAEALGTREEELRIAEARRLAAERRMEYEAQRHQERKLESLGCLAGGLAHEINNMLQPIIGLTELAMDDLPAGSTAHRNLACVITAAQRAQRLTKQVLTFSRDDWRTPHTLQLAAAVRSAADMVNIIWGRRVRIRWHVGVDDVLVHADETGVVQVLINLVSNAIDATADTEGLVVISLEKAWLAGRAARGAERPDGWYAVLSVRDNGCGMDAQTLDRAFDPFFTTKPVGQGTGLGLAMVHGLVADWNGHVSIESAVGQGTTIRILLPAV